MQTIQPTLVENRVILDPVSWDTFNQLLQELGDKRSPCLAYSQLLYGVLFNVKNN
ncbi:MAG: hypothetical protein ACRC6M_00660 [Microcystaceae cyanobacterium]